MLRCDTITATILSRIHPTLTNLDPGFLFRAPDLYVDVLKHFNSANRCLYVYEEGHLILPPRVRASDRLWVINILLFFWNIHPTLLD